THDKANRHVTATPCMTREMASDRGTPKRTGIDRRSCTRSNARSWHAYRTSKPPTHVPIATPRSHGSQPPRPPAASQPPTGATAIASPKNICVHVVYRLASEYQNTIASATGDKARHNGPRRQAAPMKMTDAKTTNQAASRLLIAPRGNSRFAVLGFKASRRASARRLKPIAALRAATMARRIQPIAVHVTGPRRAASKAPASANGSANTEWLNRTKERYTDSRLNIDDGQIDDC